MNDEVQPNIISWHQTNIRWVALCLACFMVIGNYLCYDIPAVLERELQDNLGISELEYNLLYTVYSVPNIFIPLCGGLLIDYIGIKRSLILFNVPLIVGQSCCVLGAWTKNYIYLIIGRIIFGLGAENLCVVQSTIVSKWFAKREIAFAMGMQLTFGRFGSLMNGNLTPLINDSFGLTAAMLFGLFILILSGFCCLALAFIDSNCDKRDHVANQNVGDEATLEDLKSFKLDLAMICFSGGICQSNIYVFQQNLIAMLETTYALPSKGANLLYQIPFYASAVLSPIFGFTIDRIGRRLWILIGAGVLVIFVDAWYFLMPSCVEACYQTPIIGQIGLGLFYSIYGAVVWPLIPLCVPAKTCGTAFGLATAIENLGLGLVPIAVGSIIQGASSDKTGYHWVTLYFLLMACVATIDHISLMIYSRNNPKFTNHGSSSVKVAEEENKLLHDPLSETTC